MTIISFDWLQLCILCIASLLAAVARGYAGFGYSAIVITTSSIVINPILIVPALYILEIIASLYMLPKIRHDINYKDLWPMLAGCVIGIPTGQSLLIYLAVDTTRLLLSLSVFVSAILIWRSIRFHCEMNRLLACLTGFVTGLGSGMASIGGLFAMVVFIGTNYPIPQTRAIFIVMFLVMYIYGIGISHMNGLVSEITLFIVGLLLLPMLAGIFIGTTQYTTSTTATFRRYTLMLLILISLTGVLRTILF